MPQYRCCLRVYGLILEPEHAALMNALRDLGMTYSREPRPAVDTDFCFFSEQSDRALPPPLAAALHRAGVYYEWTARSSEFSKNKELRGLFFDAESGISIWFVEPDGGIAVPDPCSRNPACPDTCRRVLGRMPSLEDQQPLLRAQNMHEALALLPSALLAPRLARHCIERRALNLGSAPGLAPS